jgi:hypothetical protein
LKSVKVFANWAKTVSDDIAGPMAAWMEENVSLTPGSRWKSAVCNTEIVVVRPTAADGAALALRGAKRLPSSD